MYNRIFQIFMVDINLLITINKYVIKADRMYRYNLQNG